jgi:hypothetical protein
MGFDIIIDTLVLEIGFAWFCGLVKRKIKSDTGSLLVRYWSSY